MTQKAASRNLSQKDFSCHGKPLDNRAISCIIFWCQSETLDSEVRGVTQEVIEKKVELALLTAFYGGMLTDKQREALIMHCEEDMSLGEIAQAAGVSRQGVHDMLTRAARKLFDMEEKLGMVARFTRMEEGLASCRACIRSGEYDRAGQIIDELIRLDQEESNGL